MPYMTMFPQWQRFGQSLKTGLNQLNQLGKKLWDYDIAFNLSISQGRGGKRERPHQFLAVV